MQMYACVSGIDGASREINIMEYSEMILMIRDKENVDLYL